MANKENGTRIASHFLAILGAVIFAGIEQVGLAPQVPPNETRAKQVKATKDFDAYLASLGFVYVPEIAGIIVGGYYAAKTAENVAFVQECEQAGSDYLESFGMAGGSYAKLSPLQKMQNAAKKARETAKNSFSANLVGKFTTAKKNGISYGDVVETYRPLIGDLLESFGMTFDEVWAEAKV